METAQNLVTNHGAPSLPLLQYYSGSLVNRNFLQQLPNPQKIRAIRNVATLLDFCGRSTSTSAEVRQHRLKIVVATPFLIEVGYSLTAFTLQPSHCLDLTICWIRRQLTLNVYQPSPQLLSSK